MPEPVSLVLPDVVVLVQHREHVQEQQIVLLEPVE
jgi:hypothetical protein